MTFKEILLPSATTRSTRTQCISCYRFIHNHSFKKRRINGSLPVAGKLLSPHKIKHIFACKRILINSKHNYICHSCNLKDLTELSIPTESIMDEKLSTYHETLSYIGTDFKNKLLSDSHRISYDTLNNEQCKTFSGLTKPHIQQLASVYNLNEKSIFLFYTKCHTDNSDCLLGEVFGMSNKSISNYFNQSIEDLYNGLVNDELGAGSWNRKKLMYTLQTLQKNYCKLMPTTL